MKQTDTIFRALFTFFLPINRNCNAFTVQNFVLNQNTIQKSFPLCRLETVDVRSKAGLAKVIGTLMSVGGATLLGLYKGAALTHTTSSVQEHGAKGITSNSSSISKERWMLGSVLLVLNCISFSLWMLLQGKLTKKYPAVFSSTAFMTSFSSMQAGVVALTTQRRLSVWLIRGNIQIIAVVFAVR